MVHCPIPYEIAPMRCNYASRGASTSLGQVRHGICSIVSTLAGFRAGVKMYVHRPASNLCSGLIIPFLSDLMASLDPSRLLTSNSFQRELWRTPPSACSTTTLYIIKIGSTWCSTDELDCLS